MNLLWLWWTDTFDPAHCRIAHGIQHLCETDCDKRRRWCIIVEVSPEWCDDGGNVNPWVDICLHHGDDRHTVFDIVDQRVRTVHDSAQNVAIIFYFFVYTLTSNCNYMICSWPDMSMCDCEPKHISGWDCILMTPIHSRWRWNTLYMYKVDMSLGASIITCSITQVRIQVILSYCQFDLSPRADVNEGLHPYNL